MPSIKEKKEELQSLAKYAGVLISFLALLFGAVQWLDTRYVDKPVFEMYQKNNEDRKLHDEQRLASIFESLERERERDIVMLHRSIRDASMAGLVIRRDILLTRGRSNLSPEELAELEILETKLRDITSW